MVWRRNPAQTLRLLSLTSGKSSISAQQEDKNVVICVQNGLVSIPVVTCECVIASVSFIYSFPGLKRWKRDVKPSSDTKSALVPTLTFLPDISCCCPGSVLTWGLVHLQIKYELGGVGHHHVPPVRVLLAFVRAPNRVVHGFRRQRGR